MKLKAEVKIDKNIMTPELLNHTRVLLMGQLEKQIEPGLPMRISNHGGDYIISTEINVEGLNDEI